MLRVVVAAVVVLRSSSAGGFGGAHTHRKLGRHLHTSYLFSISRTCTLQALHERQHHTLQHPSGRSHAHTYTPIALSAHALL
jgi:hypothetical protein